MKFITSYGVAFVLILLVGGWLVTGSFIQGGNGPGEGEKSIIGMFVGEEVTDNEPTAGETSGVSPCRGTGQACSGAITTNGDKDKEVGLQSVRTKLFIAQNMPIEVPLRGRTKAHAIISISAETSGRVEDIHVVKGQSVEVGALICTLDQGVRKTQVAQAQASLLQAKASLSQVQADFDTNKTLREKGLAAANTKRSYEVQLEAAKSSLAAAQSQLDSAELELSRTKIYTKVSGIVQDPLANVGDMMGAGTACATLVQLDPMLFVGKVAESKVSIIKEGMSANITTIGSQVINGKVSYISPSADEETRSFNVEIEMDNSNGLIRSGLSASAIIIAGEIKAQLIPQSALTLDSDGAIGVKIVDLEKKVHFVEITIIKDNNQGVFVLGLPEKAPIVIFGQEYVIDGQIVEPTMIKEEQAS
ncbi:MAG: efflux RND transporter periplasmic adaptor subunit [Devosiaceae bacterium]|nr:efflux RND transporter periplasmic adaptor subunit [Devosiaceae bacterium]